MSEVLAGPVALRGSTGTTRAAEAYSSTDVEAGGPVPGPSSMSAVGVALCGYRTGTGELVAVLADRDRPCSCAELQPVSDDFDPEAGAGAGTPTTRSTMPASRAK
ncbi:hypothetical protein [Kineococcus sp. SYSU DK006]|uniref:hypothetical protein n=1 Tax=Kineococcus sp. SYSU DK006 TaxID=3383127 RepID=UPI003D7DADB0